MNAADIHAQLGANGWRNVLAQLGIPAGALRDKHQACPACGGVDRYRFDNKRGRGDFFCNGCGAGDGFALLQRVHRWDFPTARREVMQAAGLVETSHAREITEKPPTVPREEQLAVPTSRVLRTLKGSCAVAECADAVAYLDSRALWPLPEGHGLRAHASVEYFEDGKQVGRYPALVAPVCDINGELVTAHVTYLAGGKKLETHEPRKILSPLTGREGCAVRLMPFRDGVLGIGEGIETCLSAARIQGVPVWAALNAGLLAKFEPPETVTRLKVYVDRDAAGFEAAARLMERLQGRVPLELCPPPLPANDWNDALRQKAAA